MLTKKQAMVISQCLVSAETELRGVMKSLRGKRTISASATHTLGKKVADAEKVANKAMNLVIANCIRSADDVAKCARIKIIDRLITDSAILKAQAQVAKRVIAESDEFAELESDEDAEITIEDDEDGEGKDIEIEADDNDEDIEINIDNGDDEDGEEEGDLEDIESTGEELVLDKKKIPAFRKPSTSVKASLNALNDKTFWNFGQSGK